MSEATHPPRDSLVRSFYPGVAVRGDDLADSPPTLFGHFAVFDQWTEIESAWEGHFLERIAPGSFRKTFSEQAASIRVLFQHGADPQIGDKPLGIPSRLEEDDTGAYYEAPLFDTSYNRDLTPGLRAGAYGASFRFQVMKEEFDKAPAASPYNPAALPERTIREIRLYEFGPVTFPAYAGATAGVRSLTDDYIRARLGVDPAAARGVALPDGGAGARHSDGGSRTQARPIRELRRTTRADLLAVLEPQEKQPWT